MKRGSFVIVAAVAAGVAGAVVAAPCQQQPFVPKVAVVDLKKCFDKAKYEGIKDADAQLEKFRADIEQEQGALTNKMATLAEQMKGIPDKTSNLYLEKLKEFRMTELNLDMVKKINQARFMDRYAEVKTKVYNEVRAVVTTIAQADGYDVVLRIEEPLLDDDAAGGAESVTQRINHRVVLYGSERMDITAKVIEKLNQEYQKKKAAAPKVCQKCKKESPAGSEKCTSCGEAFPK